MKNILFVLLAVCSVSTFAFGGECNNGACYSQPRKVVTSTRTVVREVIKLPRRVVTGCANGSCYSRTVTRVR